MTGVVRNNIMRSLQAAEYLYHRLVLLVGMAGSGKTDVLLDIAMELDARVVNISLVLSSGLFEMTANQRPRRVFDVLKQVTSNEEELIVLDNLEILFDPSLKQDPLRLLQALSRNQTVLASWSGTCTGGKLIYAESGHPEYRSLDAGDILIVGMDGTATVDLMQSDEGEGQA